MPFIPEDILHWMVYLNPITRLLDFFIGILLYQVFSRYRGQVSVRSANFFELASVASFILLFYFHHQIDIRYRYGVYYWPAMSAIILAFSFQKGFLSKAISYRWCIVLGEISFAFYLIHYLVMRYYIINDPTHQLQPISIVCLLLFTSLFLSFALHYLIEVPVNSWIKNRMSKKGTPLSVQARGESTEIW
jgi:peptidoglycan/LPS O-acetylase OafA/YrhL